MVIWKYLIILFVIILLTVIGKNVAFENIKKETTTWIDPNGYGTVTLEFRRYGNCINIEAEIKTKGSNLISITGFGNYYIEIPEWVKPSIENTGKIYGYTKNIKDLNYNGTSILKTEASMNITVFSTGVSKLILYAQNPIANSSEETTFHLTSNYNID